MKVKENRPQDWPPLHDKRQIQDMVHGPISLFHPLDRIVDTREFQRLRDVKQLGVTYLVYPCASHCRFVHSLGTYWLAFKFVEILKRDTSLEITGQDHLCVSLAALCHDLGHGPFSHLFDGAFRDASRAPKYTHESLSVLLLRRIVTDPEIREILEQYLGKEEEFERNITFTEELISSKKFDSDGQWLPRGRPVEKAFLFDIVANDNDSCDVDKFEYLIRDSLSTGIAIPFNKHSLERLMENSRVLPDPHHGFPRICYAKKVADIVLSVGDSRQMLHNIVYHHRVVSAIEAMIVRAMTLADEHLSYMGDDGVAYSLSRVTLNLEAYLKTTDSILRDIANSTKPEMAEAQAILRGIEKRNIPVKLEEVEWGASCVDMLNFMPVSNGNAAELEDIKKIIIRKLKQSLGSSFDEGNVLVLAKEIHRGLDGKSHPMSRVLLYDNKKKDGYVAYYVDDEWELWRCFPRGDAPDMMDREPLPAESRLSNSDTAPLSQLRLKTPQEASIWSICLYGSRSLTEEERIRVREAFIHVVTSSGLRAPVVQRGN